jgi:hypothetical protein
MLNLIIQNVNTLSDTLYVPSRTSSIPGNGTHVVEVFLSLSTSRKLNLLGKGDGIVT